MKLFTTPNSPFARIIRIPLREKNIPMSMSWSFLGLPGGAAEGQPGVQGADAALSAKTC